MSPDAYILLLPSLLCNPRGQSIHPGTTAGFSGNNKGAETTG